MIDESLAIPSTEIAPIPMDYKGLLATEPEDEYIRSLESDCLIMSLRLLGEDESTFGPECAKVMDRWRARALKALAGEAF